MWLDSPENRYNYLCFADDNYLAARTLLIHKKWIPGVYIAQQSVEMYLKLQLYCLDSEDVSEKIVRDADHDIEKLFKEVYRRMLANDFLIKDKHYYKILLKELYKGFKFRYFDKKGMLGELNLKGSASIGLKELHKFDELCCELRNSILVLGRGGTPVNDAVKERYWNRKESFNTYSFFTENKFADKFMDEDLEGNKVALIHSYDREYITDNMIEKKIRDAERFLKNKPLI